jgi:hypothetical protein
MWILHKCDNPPCVNPEHLYIGNAVDNMRDRAVRNRSNMPFGASHWEAKLNEEAVLEILRMVASGYTQKRAAGIFHVHSSVVSNIVSGKAWVQVTA